MKKFPVVEIFESMQGEGTYTGTWMSFVRFFGCDYSCDWCDSKFSWHPDFKGEYTMMSVNEILEELRALNNTIVLLTGGNPCLHDLTELFIENGKSEELLQFIWHLETQGSVIPEWLGLMDHITVSPKVCGFNVRDETMHRENFLNFWTLIFQNSLPKYVDITLKIPVHDSTNDYHKALILIEWCMHHDMMPANAYIQLITDPGDTTDDLITKWRYALEFFDSVPAYKRGVFKISIQQHHLLWQGERGK